MESLEWNFFTYNELFCTLFRDKNIIFNNIIYMIYKFSKLKHSTIVDEIAKWTKIVSEEDKKC